MTETPWTPGPWSYRLREFDDWGVVRCGDNWICQARDPRVPYNTLEQYRRDGTDPWAANARLIAAAPELYAALKRMEAHFRILPPDMDAPGSVFAQACAALTKATGETP